MKTATKPDKLSTLIKKADQQVSLFVRLSAADEHGTVTCISCDERLFWSDSDCAHYRDRDNMATRFHLPNLAPACQECNRYNHHWHIEQWELKMTADRLAGLTVLSNSLMKFTRPELEELLQDFTDKVKSLRKQKNL